MRAVSARWLSAASVAVLSVGMVVAIAAPANAALQPAPPVSSVTGSRPGATEVPFRISDQVTAFVDVGTGNLRVADQSLSLVGVNGAVGIGESYNSLSVWTGATSTPAANKWGTAEGLGDS